MNNSGEQIPSPRWYNIFELKDSKVFPGSFEKGVKELKLLVSELETQKLPTMSKVKGLFFLMIALALIFFPLNITHVRFWIGVEILLILFVRFFSFLILKPEIELLRKNPLWPEYLELIGRDVEGTNSMSDTRYEREVSSE